MIRVSSEALIACAVLLTDGQILTESSGVDVTCLQLSMQGLSLRHDLFERNRSHLVEENSKVFDASHLHQLTFGIQKVGANEVDQQLWFAISHKEVVNHFEPIILAKHLSHETGEEGPGVLLRTK